MKLTHARSCTLRKPASRGVPLSSKPVTKPPRRSQTSSRPIRCLQFISTQQRSFLGFFAVSIEDCETVGDLKNSIFVQKNLPVIAVLYRGVKLADTRRLGNFLPDLRIGPPRFLVLTRAGTRALTQGQVDGISLNVVNFSRQTFQVHLPGLDCTIRELKERIQGHEGMSADTISLTSEGKQLNAENKTLRAYGLVPGCNVRLVGRLRGGAKSELMMPELFKVPQQVFSVPKPGPVSFTDVENMEFVDKIPLARNAPEWRLTVEGLNIEGRCTNRKCNACLEMVVCGLGFTAFNVVTEEVLCPICKFSFEAETCGFRHCEWMFEGRKLGPGSIDTTSQWIAAGTCYERFDETTGENTAVWKSLVITAKHLRRRLKKDEHVNGECPICYYSFSIARFPQRVASCGHLFHDKCLTEWERLKNTKCPHCAETL